MHIYKFEKRTIGRMELSHEPSVRESDQVCLTRLNIFEILVRYCQINSQKVFSCSKTLCIYYLIKNEIVACFGFDR